MLNGRVDVIALRLVKVFDSSIVFRGDGAVEELFLIS